MLIASVLFVMFFVIALLFAMFSTFMPFMGMFGDAVQYNTAYYGALSAVERATLVTRYRGPGFDGISGRTTSGSEITSTGTASDAQLPSFFAYGDGKNELLWKITSKTTTIPALGEGNIEPAFIDITTETSLASHNYNAMSYNGLETIPLGTDERNDLDYYLGSFEEKNTNFSQLTGYFRLNPFLFDKFSGGVIVGRGNGSSNLCDGDVSSCDPDGNNVVDDVVVSWTMKGLFNNNEYTLLPKENITRSNGSVNENDTLIRKKQINQNMPFFVGQNTNPFKGKGSMDPELIIVSQDESDLMVDGASSGTFQSVIKQSQNPQLNLSLINLLLTNSAKLYPFLEYRIISETPISDRFFTIQGTSKIGSYRVKMVVKKPTLAQPSLGSFTIIF